MRLLWTSLVALTTFISCSTLNSNTVIKPNDSFILGNNQHGRFKVKLQNVSKNEIEVYQAPINGGKHSSQIVNPDNKVTIAVDANTALFIVNKSKDTASVNLKVTGDLGLSMGYKN
ncbi:MAG: hypothetical protein IPQ08_15005 [Chitinophagaceae bacterium]|nr:hypothetical protein [Chitinophagaceae bacterium]